MTSVISISGLAGTGTTTISGILSKKLGFEHVYAGRIIRDMAEEKGMDILEFNDYIILHPELDREVDDLIVAKAREGKKILEGRLSGWMLLENDIPSLKVLLTVKADEQARRVAERDMMSLEEAREVIDKREAGNKKRYDELYPGNRYLDETIYDIVIDTTERTPDEIVSMIFAQL
jgi:cytidylate kinase